MNLATFTPRREITSHLPSLPRLDRLDPVGPTTAARTQPTLNDELRIMVVDDPGPGGANHHYVVVRRNSPAGIGRPAIDPDPSAEYVGMADLLFQTGGIAEVGVNGISIEVLLAVVADRLRSFQQGSYRCKENDNALASVLDAMDYLHLRTLARVKRGPWTEEVD